MNENDTVATDEIRYGDNDRLAAQRDEGRVSRRVEVEVGQAVLARRAQLKGVLPVVARPERRAR